MYNIQILFEFCENSLEKEINQRKKNRDFFPISDLWKMLKHLLQAVNF